ncbi:MAG: protein kinase [Myxococcota bacterium]
MPILTEEERIGTVLGGRFALERILGRGGMGVVYAAKHTYTGRTVAVKLLRPEVSEDRKRAERLIREAQAAAALDHPGIVDVLDMGEVDGCLYLALELLEGRDLEKELAARGPLPASEAVTLMVGVLHALQVAHDAGIVHRDIKPSNIFLARKSGTVVPVLLDFGIAKILDTKTSTTTGTIVGTPYYMSPEAAAGDVTLGPATDLWSAAVVLYECLSGRLPFDGPSGTAVLMNILRNDPEPLDDSPLADVVMRALAREKRPSWRASEFAETLEAAAAVELRSDALPGRRPWIPAAFLAAFLVGGGVVWAFSGPSRADPAPVSPMAVETVEAIAEETTDPEDEVEETVDAGPAIAEATTMAEMPIAEMPIAEMRPAPRRIRVESPVPMSPVPVPPVPMSPEAVPPEAVSPEAVPSETTASETATSMPPVMAPRPRQDGPTLVDVNCNGTARRPRLQNDEWIAIGQVVGTPQRGWYYVPASVPRALTQCYRNQIIGGWDWMLDIDRDAVVVRAEPVRHCPVDRAVLRCVNNALRGVDLGRTASAGRTRLHVRWSRSAPGSFGRALPAETVAPSESGDMEPELRTQW